MLIVALDFKSEEKIMSMVKTLHRHIDIFKVGLEAFTHACGVVDSIKKEGKEVFLDLKFFDIPNTVCAAARFAVEKQVHMFNVHALGGFELLKKVCECTAEHAEKLGVRRPRLIAVTILTSMNDNDLLDIGINTGVRQSVMKLAEMSKRAGFDGVVCSAREVKDIKRNLGQDFLTVTPGIRPAWADKNDQKRTSTPAAAVRAGADYIVIGRPITSSHNPAESALRILKEMKEAEKTNGI